ncbi:hypothetical protein ACL9RL_02580 [Plantibacter sp. Mn2098]|uniref:hypothetical protein n=1 Tax=Plantibacter sp. Mn2098 TaxID=3395266 RepID=UPI003BEB867C
MSISVSTPVSTTLVDAPPELICIDGEFYRRHKFGGGLVAVTAKVAPSAYVDRRAMVRGHAVLLGTARLFGEAIAEDHAVLGGMTTLRDRARVGGEAILISGVIVREDAYVGGKTCLEGPIVVEGKAQVIDVNLRGRLTLR